MMVMVGDSDDEAEQALEFAFSTGRIHILSYEHFYTQ